MFFASRVALVRWTAMDALLARPLCFDGGGGCFASRIAVDALLRRPLWLCSCVCPLVCFSWVTCRSVPWLVARYVFDGRDGCFASGAAMGASLQASFWLGVNDGCYATKAAVDGRPRGPLWFGGLDEYFVSRTVMDSLFQGRDGCFASRATSASSPRCHQFRSRTARPSRFSRPYHIARPSRFSRSCCPRSHARHLRFCSRSCASNPCCRRFPSHIGRPSHFSRP